jgi:hypothetical protein
LLVKASQQWLLQHALVGRCSVCCMHRVAALQNHALPDTLIAHIRYVDWIGLLRYVHEYYDLSGIVCVGSTSQHSGQLHVPQGVTRIGVDHLGLHQLQARQAACSVLSGVVCGVHVCQFDGGVWCDSCLAVVLIASYYMCVERLCTCLLHSLFATTCVVVWLLFGCGVVVGVLVFDTAVYNIQIHSSIQYNRYSVSWSSSSSSSSLSLSLSLPLSLSLSSSSSSLSSSSSSS